jgi:hypothetical protein
MLGINASRHRGVFGTALIAHHASQQEPTENASTPPSDWTPEALVDILAFHWDAKRLGDLDHEYGATGLRPRISLAEILKGMSRNTRATLNEALASWP